MGPRNDLDELVLYTRADCHLCEVAAGLLDTQGVPWRAENIDTDLGLILRYGHRVPVLYRLEDGAELAWPFDGEAVEHFADTSSRKRE